MKKLKKLQALLLAAALSAGLLSGCAKGNTAEETGASETAEASASVSEAVPKTAEETVKPVYAERILPDSDSVVTSVTADSVTGSTISVNSTFSIVSRTNMEADELKNLLSISPEVPFELEKTEACTYTLRSTQTLPENTVTVLSVADENGDTAYKWAFQTEGSFEVRGTYPADGASYADVSTGIEITFTAAVDTKNAKDYFEIIPPVDGRFEKHRSTLYFIPSDYLEPSTDYTVKIKKDFPSADGAPLKEDFSFSFQTSRTSDYKYCYTTENSETFIAGDVTVVEIYCSDGLKNNDYSVELYKYGSSDEYYAAMKAFVDSGEDYEDYIFPTEGLESVYSSTDKLLEGTKNWGPLYLMLPENLEEGYYFANISTKSEDKEFLIQRHIQVNPISVYASSISGTSQFFINDTETGKAAEKAKIELYYDGRTVTAETGADGVATLDVSSENDSSGVLKITYGGNVFVDFYSGYNTDETCTKDLYYMYLYTDRELYRTEDTVNILGVIRPRRKNVTLPDNLSLFFGSGDTDGWEIPMKLNDDGTFTAQTSFSDLGSSWGNSINLKSGEEILYSKYICIDDYVKPTFTFTTDIPEYAVSPQSVPVKASVTAEFFEGTAADGLTFDVSDSDVKSADPAELVTDKNGYAETELLFNDHSSWEPQRCSVSFNLTGVQNEYTHTSARTFGFFRDVMLEYAYDDESHNLELNTSMITTERLTSNDLSGYYIDHDVIRGEAADVDITATLTRHWYEKKETGTYYDFLQKKTIKNYTYTHKSEIVDTYKISTSNGKAVLENLPTADENSYYYIELVWNDTQGRRTTQTIYIYNNHYYQNRESNYRYYTLSCEGGEYDEWYEKYEFTENQSLKFNLKNNYDKVSDEGGRIFFQVHGTSLIDYAIYDSTSFSHVMTADYIPTVNVCGAYFDGRHVYPINEGWSAFSFNPEEREILLEITSDKESYSPGGTAKVTVNAKDINGNAVSGAAVTLSVADEAAFAVYNQYADPLNDIYADICVPYVRKYYSYIQHCLETNGGAEKGGGGDDYYIRSNFKDTAAFLSAVTDSDGTAVFEVPLPDNLTEWRATAIAVYEKETDVIFAGASKLPIIVTQPIFIEPIMLSAIIEGDDLSVSARCYGSTAGDDVITVTVSGNGITETRTTPSNVPVNFGKLEKGEYKVLFKAENEYGSDAVELPLTVTDTLLETTLTKSFDLSEGLDVNPVRYPMSITFYDKEYMLYTDTLYKLTYQYCDRLDMRIAAAFAHKEFGFITEEEYIERFKNITPNGLAKLMTNSEYDSVLTARICAAAPELVDKTAVKQAMYNILESDNSYHDNISSAYLALAALGEPVQTEILDLLENNSFPDRETVPTPSQSDSYERTVYYDLSDGLRLCAALAMLGDYDNALKYYKEFTATAVASKNSDGEDVMYIDGFDSAELTKLALMTASVTGLSEADMMARHLIGTKQIYDSFTPELMVYLKNYSPEIEGEAVFTYQLNGETQTVTLDRHFGTRLVFGKEQLENADFKVISGGVYAVARYDGRIAENNTKPTLTVTKTLKSDTGKFELGSLVTVTINVSGGKYCAVNDVIPSCGRYDSSSGYYADRSGQRITVYTNEYGVAKYSFRIAASGEYVLESAATNSCNGNWGESGRSTIVVEDNEQDV